MSQASPVDPVELRRVAERFIAACAGGDLQSLMKVLDPAVVGWVDLGEMPSPFPQPARGRDIVAPRILALFGKRAGVRLMLAQVNGETGVLVAANGRPFAVLVLAVRDGSIAAFYSVADREKLGRVRIAATSAA